MNLTLPPAVRRPGTSRARPGPPGPAAGRRRVQRRRAAAVRATRLRGDRCPGPARGTQHRLGRVRDPGRAAAGDL